MTALLESGLNRLGIFNPEKIKGEQVGAFVRERTGVRLPRTMGSLDLAPAYRHLQRHPRSDMLISTDDGKVHLRNPLDHAIHAIDVRPEYVLREGQGDKSIHISTIVNRNTQPRFVSAEYRFGAEDGWMLRSLAVSGDSSMLPEPKPPYSRGTISNPMQGYIHSVCIYDAATGKRSDEGIATLPGTFTAAMMNLTGHDRVLTLRAHTTPLDPLIELPAVANPSDWTYPQELQIKQNAYLQSLVLLMNDDFSFGKFSIALPGVDLTVPRQLQIA